jgi:hypothetical protein
MMNNYISALSIMVTIESSLTPERIKQVQNGMESAA